MSIALEELLAAASQQIIQQQQSQAQQATLDTVLAATNAVLSQVNAVEALLTNVTFGLAALQSELATFQATTALDFTAVLTAIAAAQQSGSPVTLPTSFPSGWSAGLQSDASSGVWGTNMPYSGIAASQTLGTCWKILFPADNAGVWLSPFSKYFTFSSIFNIVGATIFNTDTPQPSEYNILASDTIVSWLTRELPTWTIDTTLEGPDTITVYQASNPLQFSCTLTEADFLALKNAITGPSATTLPPIWPGLSGVTLRSPLTLVNGLVVSGPIQGVIIAITSVPTPISYYPFGTVKSYVRAGAIVFEDDNGDAEFPQPFGPANQVILCKSMTEAASASVRLASGIVGTLTPFTIP